MKSITHQQLKLLDAAEVINLDPDKTEAAFMARQLVQATLPHSDPGQVPVWGRSNGRLTLTIKPDWEFDPKTGSSRCVGIPYGTVPRLLLFWIRGMSSRRTDFYATGLVIKKGCQKSVPFKHAKSRLFSGIMTDQQGNPI